jgi:hypothetical protein
MGSLGSYGRKCDFFWPAFDRLLTLLWDNVWAGVRPGSENVPAALRVAGVFLAGGDSCRAATSLSCQSLDEVSPAAKESGGDESGVSCERRTATVRKHVLLFVLCAVVGNAEFGVCVFREKWEYGICSSRIYEYSTDKRITVLYIYIHTVRTTTLYLVYEFTDVPALR